MKASDFIRSRKSINGKPFSLKELLHKPTGARITYWKNADTVDYRGVKHKGGLHVGNVSTPEAARRKGGALALVERLKKVSDRSKLPLMSGHTNEMSGPLFVKAGFRKSRDVYDVPLEERKKLWQKPDLHHKYVVEERSHYTYPKHFSRIDRGRVEMSRSENLAKKRRNDPIGREAGIPLTGQIAHDRYVIENRQKDIAKRDSNILRAGAAGAAAGAVLGRGRLPLKARLAAGALAGAGSVIGVRAVTHKTGRDAYGARQPWAARSEAAPAVIGTGAAGYGVYRILRKKFLKMSDARPVTEFGSAGIRRITRRYYANLAKGTIVSGSPASLQGGGFTVNNTMKQRWSGVSHKLFPEHQIVSDVRPHIPFLERMKNLNGRMGTAKDLQTIDNIGRPRLHPVNYMREEKGKLVRGPLRESYAHASNPSLAKTDYAKIIQKAKRQKKTRGVLSITDFPDTRSITVAKVSPLEIAHSKGTDKLMRRAKADKHYFAKKEKRQMNPYLMAGLSGAASGAALGILPLLRRGVGLKTALRTAAGGAAAGGAIVGGGSLLGSAILGDPDKKEGAAFTKRAAVGGALVGGTLGVAGGLVARRVPVVRSQVKKLAKEWRPANAIRKSGPIKAAAIGGVAGGAYGGAMGADEGQQVDSIRNIRKDLKRMHGFEFANKDWRDARRESRSEAAKDYMTGGGALAAGVGLGGGVGYLGWRGGKAMNQVAATAKEASKATRSARVAGAKINRASTWIKRQMTTFPTFRKLRIRLEATTDALEFEKPFSGYNKKRHARTGGLNDSYRKQYNREHGSNLKRPVTTEPSKLKPGSKAAKRRASFCARMGGMPGPTSKDGKLTPKGAALKRWNCAANQEIIEMNDRTYRPGSTAEIRSMKKTPAIKEILTKENARGKWKHRLRTLMKVLPFEARYEFQTMAPMASNPYDERERLKRQLLVTGAVATPVAGVGYAGFRSLKKSAAAIQKEEARRTLGQELRRQRAAASAVGGEVRRGKTGPRGPITRAPLPMRKSMLPETLGRNAATNRALDLGKRYESEINTRTKTRPLIRPEGDVVMQKYKTKGADGKVTERQRAKWQGGKWKTAGKSKEVFVHSRGERMKMRAALAALRTKYKFARQGAMHEFNIYTRDAETGRAASFWDQAQGRRLTRKNPLTGEVEDAPITTRSFISAARRESERLNRTRRRGTGLVKDVGEVMQGKKTKKREWEKSWFRRGVENTLGAGALLAGGLVYKRGLNKSAPKWARKFRAALDPANEGALHPKDWKGPSLTVRARRKTAAAEDWLGKKMNLSARLQSSVTQFDYYQDYYSTQGWDLRDARGNSARVFSPKAKKRTRRPAEWYEKKEGERKILGAAGLLGTAAAATAGVVIGRRFPSKKLYTKRRPRPSRDKGGGPVIDLKDYAK